MAAFELYLIRHAVAEERGDAWPDDTKRPLSEAGLSRMRKAVRGLGELGIAFDIVLTSPLVRARQTADLISAGVDGRPPVVVVEALAPGGAHAALMSELGSHGKRRHIALVGHEPGIGELAARWIGSRHPIEFKKGAICRIDLDELPPNGPGHLRWLLPPKILRVLRR